MGNKEKRRRLMQGAQHNYHTKERLALLTGKALGDPIRETFRRIASSRGPLHGYLTAVQVIMTGQVSEHTAPAADMPKEIMWGLMDRVSLVGNSHVWLQNIPGECVIGQNLLDENIQPDNHDGFVDADLTSSETPQAFRMEWLIPVCPKMFRNAGTKGPKDGIWPLAAMRDDGEIEFNILASLGGNWEIEGDTGGITVKIILHTYYSRHPIFGNPWRFQTATTADSEYDFPGLPGKCDSLWVCNKDFGTFTAPVGKPVLEVDGLDLQKGLSPFELQAAHDAGRERGIDDEWDLGMLPIICPTSQKGLVDTVKGTKFLLKDANDAQADTRYNIRRYISLGLEGTAILAGLMKVTIDPVKEPDRLEFGSSRSKAGELRFTKDEALGMNLRVKP